MQVSVLRRDLSRALTSITLSDRNWAVPLYVDSLIALTKGAPRQTPKPQPGFCYASLKITVMQLRALVRASEQKNADAIQAASESLNWPAISALARAGLFRQNLASLPPIVIQDRARAAIEQVQNSPPKEPPEGIYQGRGRPKDNLARGVGLVLYDQYTFLTGERPRSPHNWSERHGSQKSFYSCLVSVLKSLRLVANPFEVCLAVFATVQKRNKTLD